MITGLDHLVLTVRDMDATCDFYGRLLGFEVRVFAGGRKALHFPGGKINLHPHGGEFEPKAAVPTPGSADLCFLTDEPVAALAARLGAAVIEGPVRRTGAEGPLLSIYLRDPDDNLVELANPLPSDGT